MAGDCCVFKFLRRILDGKHLMRFRVKPSFSNYSGVAILWSGSEKITLHFTNKAFIAAKQTKAVIVNLHILNMHASGKSDFACAGGMHIFQIRLLYFFLHSENCQKKENFTKERSEEDSGQEGVLWNGDEGKVCVWFCHTPNARIKNEYVQCKSKESKTERKGTQ